MFGVISGCVWEEPCLSSRQGWEDDSCCGQAAGLRGKASCGVFNLFHLGLQTWPWPSERLESRRRRSRTLCSHVQVGVWCALPVAPGPGAPAASWLWRAGLVPSLGQASPGSPEAEERGCSPWLCNCAIHLYLGVFNHSDQKAPPTLWSLRGHLTGTASPGSTRPPEQLHWPAVRPAPLGRGRGAPSAPRGRMPCRPGRFYIRLYYFYYHKTFPPDSSINTAFQLWLVLLGGGSKSVWAGARGLGEPPSVCPHE